MAEQKLNLIFYHYIHFKILENFKGRNVLHSHEVSNFIATKFRVPRQIKKKVLLDLDVLGLVEVIRGDVVKINAPLKVLCFSSD